MLYDSLPSLTRVGLQYYHTTAVKSLIFTIAPLTYTYSNYNYNCLYSLFMDFTVEECGNYIGVPSTKYLKLPYYILRKLQINNCMQFK